MLLAIRSCLAYAAQSCQTGAPLRLPLHDLITSVIGYQRSHVGAVVSATFTNGGLKCYIQLLDQEMFPIPGRRTAFSKAEHLVMTRADAVITVVIQLQKN